MAEVISIKNARYEQASNGEFYISVEVNGRGCFLWYAQKLLRFGAVFLGSDFPEFKFSVTADEQDGRAGMVAVGFTNDVRIVRMVRRLIEDVDGGAVVLGPIKP